MRRTLARCAIALPLVAASLVPATAPAVAAPPLVTISGTLPGRAGMTVLVIGSAGAAKGVRLNAAGAFSIRMPARDAKDATLQLVDSAGRYAGPVVLTTRSGRAYTALGGVTVNLGRLDLKAGYARVTKSLPRNAVDPARWSAADRSGKPAGAGKLGFIRPARHLTAVRAEAGTGTADGNPGEDPDHDGLPNLFDADDNGNGTLDSVDPASARSNAGLLSTLRTDFRHALNANAGGVTRAQIDALMASEDGFGLTFFFDEHHANKHQVNSVNVDCFALVYCTRGTGTAIIGGLSESGPSLPRNTRWVQYSPDHTGLPNLEDLSPRRPHTWAMGLQPRATTSQIHPGDAFAVNFRLAGGEQVTVPTSLSAYFVTTPAITRWANSDGSTNVSYPSTSETAGELTAPDGQLTLTFWRPQRMSIPGSGETGAFVDMGRLHWGVSTYIPGEGLFGCGGHYSGLSSTLHNDYNPSSTDPANRLQPLHDVSDDAAPSPSRTISFTVDLAGCLRAQGVDPTGRYLTVALQGATESRPGGMDTSVQTFNVQL